MFVNDMNRVLREAEQARHPSNLGDVLKAATLDIDRLHEAVLLWQSLYGPGDNR